jgi:ABC-type dipeptide/oligopeptide/nickel transport system permease subunit
MEETATPANARERQRLARRSQGLSVLVTVLKDRKGIIGAAITFVLLLVAVAAPWLAPYPPLEMYKGQELQPPSAQYWFGTDEFGRDNFSRIIYGSRISIAVGAAAVFLAGLVGVSTGLAAGYLGGRVDSIIMRAWDGLLAFPGVFLAIGVVAVLGPGPVNATLAVAIINVPIFARLARASTLSEKEKEYVEAALSMGASPSRVMLRAILPNCLPSILVQMTLGVPQAILVEAALAFLGLGTQPPLPSWGTMLQSARAFMMRSAWYPIFPGAAITLLVLALSLFGDSLRDALDPTQRR